jgi:putative hydrolase of the HAD superfamily
LSHGVQLVVFDIGKVLLRICNDWRHACEVAGVKVPAGLGAGPPPPDVGDLIRRYDTGLIDLESFATAIAPHSRLTPHDVIRLQACYLLGAYPGVDQLLDDLARATVRTACLSNTSDSHWRMMHDRSGSNYLPLDRLDYRFASHLVRLRKPDDAIYEHVERQTGTRGDGIVFFDDVPENVEAARRRGWRARRVDPAPDDPIPQVRAFLRLQRVLP